MKLFRNFFILSFLIFTQSQAKSQVQSVIKKSKVLDDYRKKFGLEENMIKPSKKAIFIKNPFIDEDSVNTKDRKLDEEQEQVQVDQFYNSGDKNLDNIVESVRQIQKEGRPVIVINHNTQDDPFSLNQKPQIIEHKEQEPTFNPQQSENQNIVQEEPYSFNSITQKQVKTGVNPYYLSQQEFQTLFETLGNISSIFHVFFDGFPKWEDEQTSLSAKSIDLLRFYVKIKKFVNYIYQNQSQLGKDVDYLSTRIHLLRSTQEDMLRFYEIDHIYFQANLKYHQLTFNGKQTLKSQIDNEFSQISETTYLYDTDVKKAFSSVYNLNKFTQFFLQQIDTLKNNQYENSLMNALDKFDAIMMLTYRVLTMKADIEKSIIDLQESLQNIKVYKPQLELNLQTINKYLELVRLTEKEEKVVEKEKGFLMTNTMLIIVLILSWI